MDYCVRYVALPYTVKGVTVISEDDFYNVYINSLLPLEEQKKSLWHELTHIRRNDFYAQERTIQEIESM